VVWQTQSKVHQVQTKKKNSLVGMRA